MTTETVATTKNCSPETSRVAGKQQRPCFCCHETIHSASFTLSPYDALLTEPCLCAALQDLTSQKRWAHRELCSTWTCA